MYHASCALTAALESRYQGMAPELLDIYRDLHMQRP
jgi:hypothetical protein